MTPSEIARLETPEQRETEIQKYGESVFHDTKRMVDRFIGHFSEFVSEYKTVRRATVKNEPNAAELQRNLDKRAAELFN